MKVEKSDWRASPRSTRQPANRLIFFPLLSSSKYQSPIMASANLPECFNATSQDIEMLLAAQCHLGSKNHQVRMEPYIWKTRPDGVNVINIGKTWYVISTVFPVKIGTGEEEPR